MSGYTHSDLGLVRTFEAVASLGSFSDAARQLGLSQSTASEHVRLLELKVGVRLLQRTTRQVRLTSAGKEMWNYAQSLLQVSSRILNHFAAANDREVIRLGIAEDLAHSRFPKIIRLFVDCFPGFELSIRTGATPDLMKMLNAQDLDMVVGKRGIGGQGGRVLWTNPTVWVARKPVPPSLQEPVPLLMITAPSVLRSIALDALAEHGRAYRIVFESNSFTALRAAFEIGHGVTVGLENYLPDFVQPIEIDGSLPPLPAVEIFTEHRHGQLSPSARSFAAFIEDALVRLHSSDSPEAAVVGVPGQAEMTSSLGPDGDGSSASEVS